MGELFLATGILLGYKRLYIINWRFIWIFLYLNKDSD